MKLLSFEQGQSPRRLGVLQGDEVVDIDDLVRQAEFGPAQMQALQNAGVEPAAGGLLRYLQLGQAHATLHAAIHTRVQSQTHRMALSEVTLRAPLSRPGKIVAVGRNYADHAKETGVAPFEKPRIIFKVPSSIADPGAVIPKPIHVQKMDFEVELAVVMGAFASHVKHDDALGMVAGYTVLNDLSAREFQFDISPPQTTFAKSIDGFCPLGPWMVTADEIPDPQDLWVRTWLNGQPMQEGHTADMLFTVRDLMTYVSQYMTLEPGDILATGTPAGIGAFRQPPVWLQSGDVLRMEVTGVGVLENRIV